MKNRFRIAKTVLIFTLLSAIVLTAAGCKENYDPSKKVGIDKLEVISATGNKDNWNNLLRYNRWDDSEYSAWLRSDKAMKLIDGWIEPLLLPLHWKLILDHQGSPRI